MPKFVIEREIPKIGASSPEQYRGIAGQSCAALEVMGPRIQWVHSYVVADKTYCVYIAPDAESIRRHAAQAGFPANRISEVRTIIDPTTRER